MKYILVCDESGAKGYADRDEAFPGEVGVFAGILLRDDQIQSVVSQLQPIADQQLTAKGKLHITDLQPDDQQKLRAQIFDILIANKVPCFWYAVHVAGFHKTFNTQESQMSELRQDIITRHGPQGPRIKTSSPRSDPASLHVELFDGLFGRAAAYVIDRADPDADVEVWMDHVDKAIAAKFEKAAKQLFDDSPKTIAASAFDTKTKQVIHASATFTTDFPDAFNCGVAVAPAEFKTLPGDHGLILAADVLANSLNHLFKGRSPEALFSDLNDRSAVANHQLFKCFDVFGQWEGRDFGDVMYQHPQRGTLSK